METINLRNCFPVIDGGDGLIFSKRGDITFAWELTLPPAFRCNPERYDSLVTTFKAAISMLPDWSIVHKQDLFFKKRYIREERSGFLSSAYERHHDGRQYLSHRCRLFVTFSNRKNARGGVNGLMGFPSMSLPDKAEVGKFLGAAQQFEAIVNSNDLLSLRRLEPEEIFGSMESPGLLQDYLNFADCGGDFLSDIAISHDRVQSGDRFMSCHLFSDLDQMPGEVSPCRKVQALSTDNSTVNLCFLSDIGQSLDCDHIVNQFIMRESVSEAHRELANRAKRMNAMSLKSNEDRIYSEEIKDYLDEAAASQTFTVKAHMNILAIGSEAELTEVKNKVTASIFMTGITPIVDIHDVPLQYWASMPGNEAGLSYNEYMTMRLEPALCLWLYDGLDSGIKDGFMKICDRQRLIPVRFDTLEGAMREGLTDNLNMFLLGPSGSGKSFFMNTYLHSCYEAGAHCFLIDMGESYRGHCHIIREESGGRDGAYYSFESGKPISFNPFRNVGRFLADGSLSQEFLFTLMCSLWTCGTDEDGRTVSANELKYIKESVTMFVSSWKLKRDPIFNDYYKYLCGTFKKYIDKNKVPKEHFDMASYASVLGQFAEGGLYDYLLNSKESIDMLDNRFVVFEIDKIKDNRILFPITTLIIMDAFMEKMSSSSDLKVMVIEEAWKALQGTMMSGYMLELWKTARKHRTSAVLVTQELKDITSSPVIKDSIVTNSAVKVLLDMSKHTFKFEELAESMSLGEDDKSMILSLGKLNKTARGKEVFFNLGNKKSYVMRVDVSPEETIAYSSRKEDRERLESEATRCGSYIQAVRNIAKTLVLSLLLLFMGPQKASAQFATFDASNLAQAVLSFVQDGDNIAINTEQFLTNLGVMQEQLGFLQETSKRFREVKSYIYKGQEVIRIAKNYEMTLNMFGRYVERMKDLSGQEVQYYQVRSAVNEGFNYLLYASREVKRAREFLSKNAAISEEERIKGLIECDRQVSRANAAMAKHIIRQYDAIDRGRIIAANKKALDDAFKMKY